MKYMYSSFIHDKGIENIYILFVNSMDSTVFCL